MKNKLIIFLILLNLFIPFIHAENETVVNTDDSIDASKIEEQLKEIIETTLSNETSLFNETTTGIDYPPTNVIQNTKDNYIETVVNGKKLIIDDSANLLTEEERELLVKDMTPSTSYGHIVFVTTSSNYSSANDFADNYYHSKFNKKENGTLFLIDMSNRKIYIFSDGKNYNIITTGKAQIITDNIYGYAKRAEYYKCSKLAFEQIYTVLDGGKISEPMRYASNIVLSLVIAFFIGFLRVLKNAKIPSPTTQEIINGCAVSFAVANIVGTKIGTHTVYVPPSSSSGGSSGGGGGGGGHSGGGGGHSF